MRDIAIHARIDSETYDALMKVAAKEDRTLSFVIARILKAEMSRKGKSGAK